MADWWDTDAADPTHPAVAQPELPVRAGGFMSLPIPPAQQSEASGWWSRDNADPEHPARPAPTVTTPQNYAAAELQAGMPTALPGIGAGLASSMVMGPMQAIAHGIEAAVPPQTATPASKILDTANQRLQQGPAEYQIGRGIGTTLGPLAAAPLLPMPATALGRIAAGTGYGAGFGAATLVDNQQNFWQ